MRSSGFMQSRVWMLLVLLTAVCAVTTLPALVALGVPTSPLPQPGGGGQVIVPPPIGGLDPGTTSPPEAPATVTITGRTVSSISITWRDRANFEDGYELQRSLSADGEGEVIAAFGPISSWGAYTDEAGLSPDTLYCYRLRVYNAHGGKFSPQRCAYTQGFER